MTRQGRVADACVAGLMVGASGVTPDVFAIATLIQSITGAKPQKVTSAVASLIGNTDRSTWARFQEVTAPELMAAGLTATQAHRLLGAIEFGKRVFTAPPSTVCVDDPAIAAQLLQYDLGFSSIEKAAVLVLDAKHCLIAKEVFAIGSRTECIIHPALVFEAVIKHRGSRFILAHCHPSGCLEPSDEDIAVTVDLIAASELMGLPMLDHLVMGWGGFGSIRKMRAELWG